VRTRESRHYRQDAPDSRRVSCSPRSDSDRVRLRLALSTARGRSVSAATMKGMNGTARLQQQSGPGCSPGMRRLILQRGGNHLPHEAHVFTEPGTSCTSPQDPFARVEVEDRVSWCHTPC
jgi:hypothetical protein